MLNSQLIFMLELLDFLLWCILVMLLILCGGLNPRFHLLTDEKNLTVLVVQVFRPRLNPSQTTELVDKPAYGQPAKLGRNRAYLLFRKIWLLGKLSLGWSTTLGVLDADDETALIFDTKVLLYLPKFGWDSGRIDKVARTVLSACDSIHALGHWCNRFSAAAALCLRVVLFCTEEALFQLLHCGICFLDECHEAIIVRLWEHLLRKREQTVVVIVCERAVTEFGTGWHGPQDEEGALEITHAFGFFDTNAVASEEVDDTFFKDV